MQQYNCVIIEDESLAAEILQDYIADVPFLNRKHAYLDAVTSKYNADISLSWFKDSAKEHIKKIQDLIEIAEHYDIVIERIASKNPGYIVFEDEYQVSAVPFKIDRKRVI